MHYLLDTAGNGCLGLNVQRLDLLDERLLLLTLQTHRDEMESGVCVLYQYIYIYIIQYNQELKQLVN